MIVEQTGGPNRPRRGAAVKIRQILEAAERLFLEQGYMATNMESVARAAGVGKATLYVYFAGKAELLRAVIGRADERMLGDLAGYGGNKPLRAKLLQLGGDLLDHLMAPGTVAVHRMVIAESRLFPEVGALFYEGGPEKLLNRLETLFADLMKAGQMQPGNPRHAAEQFIGAIRGDMQLRAMLGLASGTARQRDETLRAGVDMFIRAYGAAAEQKGETP
jgi:AcrR family transcriptional regulator